MKPRETKGLQLLPRTFFFFLRGRGGSWDLQLPVKRQQSLPAGGTLGERCCLLPRRALGVLAEGRGLPQSVCTFSVAFDSGPNAWLCECRGDGWECSLARLAGGSHRGCWASARSFPSAGKLSFLSRLEGVCPNSNSQLSRSHC